VVVAGVGLAACAGGRARRRRVLRPAHGRRAQSKCLGIFMGGQWSFRCKESKGGLPCSSVYVRWRLEEVRRWISGTTGEVVLSLRARKASRNSGEASRGVGLDGGGPEWLVHGGQGSGATGTPCAEGTTMISCVGGAESQRGSTV
jgi:hypothetical protein